MAVFSKEDQSITAKIPDNAEVFIHSAGPPYDEVFIRVGDKLYTVNFNAEGEQRGFKGEEARTQGRQILAQALGFASWNDAQNKLPKRNTADVVLAFNQPRGQSISENVSLDQFLNLVKTTPKGGGDITANAEGQFTQAPTTGQPRGTSQ